MEPVARGEYGATGELHADSPTHYPKGLKLLIESLFNHRASPPFFGGVVITVDGIAPSPRAGIKRTEGSPVSKA